MPSTAPFTQYTQPKYSIFTHSVGYHTASHSILTKLASIASAGFDAVELFSDDLFHFSQSSTFASILSNSSSSTPSSALLTPPDSPLSTSCAAALLRQQNEEKRWFNAYGECTMETFELELAAAKYLQGYCAGLGLEVCCLQPLRDVEGWIDEADRVTAMERVKSRFAIMRALNTHLLLICSQTTPAPATTGNLDVLIADFALISDMAATFSAETGHDVKIGFEALSWGAHVDLWSKAWAVVKQTDQANVGLILDSFNTLANEFADPCSSTGIQEPASLTLSGLEGSFKKIAQEVPGEKILLLQIGDAKRLPEPLEPSPRQGESRPSRMIWSRSSRLYPCEKERGAFMPVQQFVAAVAKTGYAGAWSIEVFNDSLSDPSPKVPTEHARRARAGLDKLVEQIFC